MAYNKRNWKARQGTGLNYFSIDGATPVPIVNQPTTLTEAGDALSAGNLNDWEQRIKDGFDDADASIANVQSEINQHESRLQNLEQKAGDYTTVQYRGTDAVPTGKAKYGLVKNIVGKTRAWNQLIPELLASNFTTGSIYSSVLSNDSDGNLVATSTSGIDISCVCPFVSGRKYLVSVILKSSISGNMAFFAGSTNLKTETISSANTYQTITVILSPNANTAMFRIVRSASAGETLTVNKWLVRDLTTIFPEGVPSTIAECVQKCPDILKYNAYDAGSLVDTVVGGVKSVGVNIWDEEWEVGEINNTTGQNASASDRFRSKNYIPVHGSAAYYFKAPSGNWYIYEYDADNNFIGINNSFTPADSSFTTSVNCYYIRFRPAFASGTSYNHDIQICLNSYADKTTYHPYKSDTLSLPETVTLRSAGSVSDELDVESGVVTRKTYKYTVTGNEPYTYRSTGTVSYFYLAINVTDEYSPKQNLLGGFVSDKFIEGNAYNGTEPYCANFDNKRLYFTLPSSYGSSEGLAYVTGAHLVYELATPYTESIDPIIDNFIEVQGGGTIDTIQDQTPVIDNCLDVGYLAV